MSKVNNAHPASAKYAFDPVAADLLRHLWLSLSRLLKTGAITIPQAQVNTKVPGRCIPIVPDQRWSALTDR
jgi:hypothetical protein